MAKIAFLRLLTHSTLKYLKNPCKHKVQTHRNIGNQNQNRLPSLATDINLTSIVNHILLPQSLQSNPIWITNHFWSTENAKKMFIFRRLVND